MTKMYRLYALDAAWRCSSSFSKRVAGLLGSCIMLANLCIIRLSVAPGSSSTSANYALLPCCFPLAKPIDRPGRLRIASTSADILLLCVSSLCILYILSLFPASLLFLDCPSSCIIPCSPWALMSALLLHCSLHSCGTCYIPGTCAPLLDCCVPLNSYFFPLLILPRCCAPSCVCVCCSPQLRVSILCK